VKSDYPLEVALDGDGVHIPEKFCWVYLVPSFQSIWHVIVSVSNKNSVVEVYKPGPALIDLDIAKLTLAPLCIPTSLSREHRGASQLSSVIHTHPEGKSCHSPWNLTVLEEVGVSTFDLSHVNPPSGFPSSRSQ
jgi:hypothetical protein